MKGQAIADYLALCAIVALLVAAGVAAGRADVASDLASTIRTAILDEGQASADAVAIAAAATAVPARAELDDARSLLARDIGAERAAAELERLAAAQARAALSGTHFDVVVTVTGPARVVLVDAAAERDATDERRRAVEARSEREAAIAGLEFVLRRVPWVGVPLTAAAVIDAGLAFTEPVGVPAGTRAGDVVACVPVLAVAAPVDGTGREADLERAAVAAGGGRTPRSFSAIAVVRFGRVIDLALAEPGGCDG